MALGERQDFFVSWHISTQAISANLWCWLMLFLNPAAMARRPFDLRLIPEFGGAASDEPIIEWLEQVEMICELADEERVECILPLRLTGGALIMHWQISKEQRADIKEIKHAHSTVFAVDAFVAFKQFAMWWLHDGETVDEFLAALKRLACQVSKRTPEKWIACGFVAGLPQHVRQQLQALVRIDALTLDQLCCCWWA